jgi:hypothetical protein
MGCFRTSWLVVRDMFINEATQRPSQRHESARPLVHPGFFDDSHSDVRHLYLIIFFLTFRFLSLL